MQHLCPRCRQAITTFEDGTLSFCVHCGAPQVRVHPELLAAQGAGPATVPPDAPALPAPGVPWRGAIQCAALAGAGSLLLAAVTAVLPALGLLGLLWAISAPVIVLGIYVTRFQVTDIRPRFGARLGLLTGIAVMLGSIVVNVTEGVLARLVFHNVGSLDASMAGVFAQTQQRVLGLAANNSPQAADAAAQMAHILSIPEFRAGMLLFGLAIPAMMYLALSTAGGAFAGFLRMRNASR